jgi:hypothetical protein
MSETANPYDQLARLSNGTLVTLREASAIWSDLQTLNLHPRERSYLLTLRDHALTNTAFTPGEPREALQSLNLIDASGHLRAAVREVVLSAMHGDLENVQVVCPFAEFKDRMLAEFFVATDSVKGDLRPQIAEFVLKSVIGEDWLRRIQPTDPNRGGGFSRN